MTGCVNIITMAKPVAATDADFDQITEKGLVLVDFWAEWCGPCRMIGPIIEELADQFEGQLSVAKLDVDANPKTAMRFRVMSIPTVILFKDGRAIETIVGAQSKRNFESRINKHLAKA